MTSDPLEEALARTERIAVIGSPSSTSGMQVDILGTASEKQLVGAFVFFRYTQEGSPHCGLGQISEVGLRNVWAEDATMKGLIRLKGQVDPVTGRQDVHTAKLGVGAVFSVQKDGFEQAMLGTVPSTGTPLHLVDDAFLNKLLEPQLDELVYLGRTYGSPTLLPMWFRHFGAGEGGLKESYHLGVFGKTGSGKSFLSKMILVAYARHPMMSIIVLDPQGEYSRDLREGGRLKVELDRLGRPFKRYGVGELVLPGTKELLRKVLISSRFLDSIYIFHEDNKTRAVDKIFSELWLLHRQDASVPREEKAGWKAVAAAHRKPVFEHIWRKLADDNFLKGIYSGEDGRIRVREGVLNIDPDEAYEQWSKITRLFSSENRGPYALLGGIADMVTGDGGGHVVVVDLSKESVPDNLYWDDEIQLDVLNALFVELTKKAESRYREGKMCNTLVLLDEAHRLAPRETPLEEPGKQSSRVDVKRTLIDSVKTTRKYGVGWMFVSQTLSGIDQEILNQLRLYFVGFGLGWGGEYRSLRELIGGNDEAIRLYQSLRDPQSSISNPAYPFMAIGPVSPLSFSGAPLFMNALKFPDEFSNLNPRLYKRRN
jgi:hypothetical protein